MSTAGSPLEALKGGFRSACVKRLVGDENGASLKRIVARLLIAMGKGIAYHWRGEKIAELQISR